MLTAVSRRVLEPMALTEIPLPEEIFGMALRRERLRSGMTQLELGAKSGVAQNLISAYELGKVQRPRSEHIVGLEDALGLERGALWSLAGMPRMAQQLREATVAPPGALIITDATADQRKVIRTILKIDAKAVRRVLSHMRDLLHAEEESADLKLQRAQEAIRRRQQAEQQDAG